jgi:hypothetical protein
MTLVPKIVVPTKLAVQQQLVEVCSVLDSLGIEHNVNPEEEIDWADYFERIQKKLLLSGSGQRSGTIVLTDWYPLKRTVEVDSHVEIKGAYRAKHHLGSSCGFLAEEGFAGDWVLRWKKSKPSANYSNFGAGLRNVHIRARDGVSGVYFRGAQQSAGVDNLVVRGFGEDGVGVRLGGDTYSVRDVFSDATHKPGSYARDGAVAYELGENRVYSLRLENITSHNCEIGLKWGDAHQISIENYETELTTRPIVCTWDARGINIRNACFRHTENAMDLERIRWPSEARIKFDGMMNDNVPGKVVLPGGKEVAISKCFDVVIEGNSRKVEVIDLKAQRAS